MATLNLTIKEKVKRTSFDWVLIGFTIHALGGVFFATSKMLCYPLCALGLIIIVANSFFQKKYDYPSHGVFRFLFYFYLFWSVFILIRPFFAPGRFDTDGYSLINRFTWLAFTPPLIIFFGCKRLSLKSIYTWCAIHGVIGVGLLLMNYRAIFTSNQNFDSDGYQEYIGLIDFPLQFLTVASFLLLCHSFVRPRYRYISYIATLLSLYTALFTARRGNLFMYMVIVLFAAYIFIIASKKSTRILKIIVGVSASTIGILLFITYSSSSFSFFLERLDEDTRSGVEDFFYYSFNGHTLDWIIGRGINGSYYCPIFTNTNRGVIETGYLHMILKGGIIYLGLFVIILLHAAYLGFFKTKNVLSKGMAFYILAHIIFLMPYGLPMFSFEYIILWVCIAYCESKAFRMCTNNELKMNPHFT
ncbi:MAG: hypothetical protein QM726_03285 [Chitinophagaceae bacterium]